MIINSSNYANGMKEKNHNRDYLKKKKSQQAFFIKAKVNAQLGQQLKYLQPRKSQPRLSTSLVQINPKEVARRVGSLQMTPNELANMERMIPTKSSQRNIGHCWSERNVTLINDSVKMHKYRKFSSNAQFAQQQAPLQSHRRKLSLVDHPSAEPTRKIEKLSMMVWLILIRKLFADQFRKRNSKTIKLNILYSYIQKLENGGLVQFSLLVEPLEYQVDLSKSQIIVILEAFFSASKKPKTIRAQSGKATFCQVMNCLIQFQSKNNHLTKQNNHKSTSSEQEAIETARFQQGSTNQEVKKRKLSEKKHQLNSLIPKMQTHKYMKEKGKENAVASVNMSGEKLFKSPSACNKNKQSLNPSQSPFINTDSKSIQNSRVILEREESGPFITKKGSFEIEGTHGESLGMLTIEGKSPRELMVSQIYESIQREGFVHQNNVSFSLQHLETDNHLSFQHTVHSLQQILKKIQTIQRGYQCKIENQFIDDLKQTKNEQQINLFLEQLINYRIASSCDPFEQDSYSYLVSFQNLSEFKDHNKGIMLALLQSIYLKEYFNALEGLKIRNSLQFLKNISHLLHPGIKIMNISHNNISNINFILDVIPNNNFLEFLNINNNFFPDVSPILKKFSKLQELHCHSNMVSRIKDCKQAQELKIIDLSCNKLQNENDIAGLVGISSLIIINLFDNPLTKKKWKDEWGGNININKIYTMQNLYVMSSFGHQKDIAFSVDRTIPKNEKDRYKSIDFIHQSSISQANRTTGNQSKFDKPSVKLENQLNASKQSLRPPEQPKQKISKIKAFIDGKII